MARPVADLQQAFPSCAAAAGKAVAAIRARELDAERLEPANRAGGLAREHLDQLGIRRLVGGGEHVGGVLLGRIVVTERGLDAALGLRRVVGLQRALGGERNPGAGPLGRDGGSEPGGAAADHEHVEYRSGRLHTRDDT